METLASIVVSLSYPPMLSACVLAAAALLWWRRRRRVALALAVAGVAWSMLWSIPLASNALRGVLEHRHAVREASELPHADAIVVLGGGSNYAWLDHPDVDPDRLHSSRLAAGARAWHAGKASKIILSGGAVGGTTEARRMATAIQRLGVPDEALVLEERSRDTRDNARYSMALADAQGGRKVLLVTSALHMPRAVACFEANGVSATPYPVDYTIRPSGAGTARSVIGNLRQVDTALHEWIGLAYYRLRGRTRTLLPG